MELVTAFLKRLIISLFVGAEGEVLGADAVLGAECAIKVCVIPKSALLIDLSRRMPRGDQLLCQKQAFQDDVMVNSRADPLTEFVG